MLSKIYSLHEKLVKPIGEVVDYFWRIEFQLQGSPHVHSLWWVKDAPDLQTVEDLRAVPCFIDKYITTKIPTEGEDDELRMRLQRHKPTHTCQKNSRRGSRFDYPKQPSPEIRLKTNADGGNKARIYVIKREPGAEILTMSTYYVHGEPIWMYRQLALCMVLPCMRHTTSAKTNHKHLSR